MKGNIPPLPLQVGQHNKGNIPPLPPQVGQHNKDNIPPLPPQVDQHNNSVRHISHIPPGQRITNDLYVMQLSDTSLIQETDL